MGHGNHRLVIFYPPKHTRKKKKAIAITKEQCNAEYTQSVKGKVQIYKFCRKSEKSRNNGKVCIELLNSLVKRYRELKFYSRIKR